MDDGTRRFAQPAPASGVFSGVAHAAPHTIPRGNADVFVFCRRAPLLGRAESDSHRAPRGVRIRAGSAVFAHQRIVDSPRTLTGSRSLFG
jgi:hypothetical protein